MVNRIAGVIGSLYYVGQAEKVQKGTDVDKSFKKRETERIAKVQRVSKINTLNEQERDVRRNNYFKTEIVTKQKEKQTTVYTNSCYGYKQINLEGKENKVDSTLINPCKIKAAYFSQEA